MRLSKNNPLLCFWAVSVALFALFTVGTASAAEERPILTVVENDWPPYFFAGKADAPEGFAKELLKPCLEQAGYGHKFEFYPVKRMYSYLETGKLDIALFSYKKSREALVEYGREPIFSSGYWPIVRADSDIRIESLSDFDGLKLCHLAGLRYSKEFLEYIKKRQQAGTLVVSTLGSSCLKMLLEGIVDVYVDTKDTSLWRAKQMDVLDKIRVVDFDIQTKDYFVTISKKSDAVKNKGSVLGTVDMCLKKAKKDGSYNKIAKRYGLR
jgi:ABC-type amino acid transport substrate-binding protein